MLERSGKGGESESLEIRGLIVDHRLDAVPVEPSYRYRQPFTSCEKNTSYFYALKVDENYFAVGRKIAFITFINVQTALTESNRNDLTFPLYVNYVVFHDAKNY